MWCHEEMIFFKANCALTKNGQALHCGEIDEATLIVQSKRQVVMIFLEIIL